MKTFFIFTLYLSTFLPDIVYSTDTASIKYLPLRSNSIYVYKKTYESDIGGYITYIKSLIVRDTVINSKKYFLFQNFPRLGNGWLRVDSSTGSIMQYDPTCSFYSGERLIDSLALKKSSVYPYNYQGGSCGGTSYIYCKDTGNFTLFNTPCHWRRFSKFFFVSQYQGWTYSEYFGLLYYNEGVYSGPAHFWDITISLTGCVLNGTVYGDTTMPLTGLEPIFNYIPNTFSLSQNYPNPFNPQTKIKFAISQTSFTKLIIYDLIGREVATLVNEELRPGTYEADWDASNFSSGVYFYKIISNDFVETKKMVLMK